MSVIIQPLSDLHGNLPEIPRCDLVLIAGDICPAEDHDKEYQMSWIQSSFGPWMNSLPAREIVWIAGNHDFVTEAEDFSDIVGSLPGIYLQDSETVFDGLRIWGSPWINTVAHGFDWAWETDEKGMKEVFSRVPEETDIMLTHSPLYGYGDRCQSGQRVGSESLLEEVRRVEPRLLVSGHIHEDPGVRTLGETMVFSYPHIDEHFVGREGIAPQIHLGEGAAEIIA